MPESLPDETELSHTIPVQAIPYSRESAKRHSSLGTIFLWIGIGFSALMTSISLGIHLLPRLNQAQLGIGFLFDAIAAVLILSITHFCSLFTGLIVFRIAERRTRLKIVCVAVMLADLAILYVSMN